MSTYVFKAMDLAGVRAKGEVESESRRAANEQLKARGLIVLELNDKRRSAEIELSFLQRVSASELAIFARQFATMISSGMSILRSLHVLEEQTESRFLKGTIVAVRRDVEAGSALSDAMERHPRVFSTLFVAMTRAGETGGLLEESLLRVADQLEKDAALKRQIRAAMVYPSLVISVALAVMLALVAFLIPVFEGVFQEFGGHLPAITSFSVGLSHLLTRRWYLLLLALVVIVPAFVMWRRSEAGRRQWDRMSLRLPMRIGAIVQEVAIARWARTLASLTAAGVPLLQALEIVGKTAGNVVVDEAMEDVIASVKRGGTLAAPLDQSRIFPAMVTHMVGVGEETGALDTMLEKVAEFYEERVEVSVKTLTSLMEPIMIVVIGSMVGFIVISMYLPLFTVYNNIE